MATYGSRLSPVVRIALLALLAAWCWGAEAQVPDKINYQGLLTTASGGPVAGPVQMVFTLYDGGGTQKYSETQTVTLSNGVFNVTIGNLPAFSALPFDIPYFLGVKVGADPEMTPRQAVLASPYALNSASAEALAASATVAGAQITGSISAATVPTSQVTGTVSAAQIANNAVTQAKLSPATGAAAGKVLGTDGTNLQWQTEGGGTVTSVGTGTGLTGGPITGSGTINLTSTQLLPTVACGGGQVPTWSGSLWSCADPSTFTGNIALQNSTSASVGNITKNGARFLHNHGGSNTFLGENAGNFALTGPFNTGVGREALNGLTTGSFNTAHGYLALNLNQSGSSNIAIGYGAGFLTTGDYNIDIGNQGAATEVGTIRIGDFNQSRAFISGIRDVTTGAGDAIAVVVDSAGQLGTISSSRKVKDDIADMGEASSLLMRLRPVTFYYKGQAGNSSRTLQYGLIAEEVADIAPELVAHKTNGEIETVYYQFLAPMLLNEFQKQQRTIDAQAAALSSQTTRIAELERDRQVQIARVNSLEQQILEIAVLKHQVAQMAQRQQQAAGLAKAASRPGPLETAKLAAAE